MSCRAPAAATSTPPVAMGTSRPPAIWAPLPATWRAAASQLPHRCAAAQLAGPLLYVREAFPGDAPLQDLFASVEKVGEVERKRGPLVIETYALHLLRGPKGDVFDRTPPLEMQ